MGQVCTIAPAASSAATSRERAPTRQAPRGCPGREAASDGAASRASARNAAAGLGCVSPSNANRRRAPASGDASGASSIESTGARQASRPAAGRTHSSRVRVRKTPAKRSRIAGQALRSFWPGRSPAQVPCRPGDWRRNAVRSRRPRHTCRPWSHSCRRRARRRRRCCRAPLVRPDALLAESLEGGHQMGDAIDHRDVDGLASPSLARVDRGRQHADRQIERAAAKIRDQVERRRRRAVGIAKAVQRAGQREIVDVVSRFLRERARPVPSRSCAR